MAGENEAADLSADEQAFFASGGETELAAPAEQPSEGAEQGSEDITPPQTDQPDKGKFVPHGALHAEREEHKKTKAHLEEIARKQAVLEDRWNTLLKVGEKPKTEEEAPPNPDEDIFAYAKWQAKQLEQMKGTISQREQHEQQARQMAEEDQAIRSIWNNSVQQFSAETPDFKDAANYLAGLRIQQLAALGLDQRTINTTIDNEIKGVVKSAQQAGKSPAELIYNYAKVSGYSGKAKEMTDAEKRVQEIDAAQQRGKTLAGQPGGSSSDPLTAEAIAAMSQDEFNAWHEKPENRRRFEKLMGA